MVKNKETGSELKGSPKRMHNIKATLQDDDFNEIDLPKPKPECDMYFED